MITIVLFKSTGIISWIIRTFQKSPISHCAIGLDIDNVPMYLHSTMGGIQLTPKEKVLKDHEIVAEYEILADFNDEIPAALKRLGEKYNTAGLLGYIFVLLGRNLNIKIKNPFARKDAAVCSEFVVECDINKEIPEFIDKEPSSVTPRDLFEICENGSSFRKLR